MTLLQITAILSLLIAFGVDTPTVNHIHDLLIPPVASTTPIVPVPVVQTPVVQNAPVYFGSTAPVPVYIPPQPAQPVDTVPLTAPVVQSTPMDTTPPKFELFSIDKLSGVNYLRLITNETLDFKNTKLPQGVAMEITIEHKYNGVERFGNGALDKPAYYYEAILTGTPGQIDVTVQDTSGNGVTKTLTLY